MHKHACCVNVDIGCWRLLVDGVTDKVSVSSSELVYPD